MLAVTTRSLAPMMRPPTSGAAWSPRLEEAAADGDARGCRPDADREFPP